MVIINNLESADDDGFKWASHFGQLVLQDQNAKIQS